MKDTRCELVRRQLEEALLNEEFGTAAAEHLRGCADCREFERQQTKLRQIVGSLGTVNAPADFDFRLRARLASDSHDARLRYWSFAVKGLATAAILVVFGVGMAVLWQRGSHEAPVADATRVEPARPQEPKAIALPAQPASSPAPKASPVLAGSNEPKRRVERQFVASAKRSLISRDVSSEGANVVSITHPARNNEPVFPIDASLQSLKVSLDDGRGNARTISFPTVSFGSQRLWTNANQLAPKGIW